MGEELYAFDAEDADKIAQMLRDYSRRQKGDLTEPEDFRLTGRSVAVRLTGPADPANSDMYPAVVAEWRPGPLAAIDGSGYADTTSFSEIDLHWSTNKNEDGEVPAECWVIISASELGGLPPDPATEVVIVDGIIVGEHPTTGALIVLRSFWAGDPNECPAEPPSVKRELIGVYQDKSGGYVTDVYQRFQDVTTDENGCVTRGDVYCVVAPSSCGSGPREVDYYCIDGLCWAYYDGLVPTAFDAGPFTTPELCDDGCPFPPEGVGEGEFDCCPGETAATLTATISGGEGTMTLYWDGSTFWAGSKLLTCGETLFIRYYNDCFLVDYSCSGSKWLPCPSSIGTPTCTPFADPRTHDCDMNGVNAGCVAASCGTFTVTVAL